MAIRTMYTEDEIKNLPKEEFMRVATYDDMMFYDVITFEVATLLRESTDKEEQKRAYDNQKESILGIIQRKPNFVLKDSNIFEDEGYSGVKADTRPGFQLMELKAKKHCFDVVVVDAVSRLARNVEDLFRVVNSFKELGIGFLIVKERYWTYNLSPVDTVRLAIDGGLAQTESMQTGVRVRCRMEEIAKNGQLLGGDMFGYRLKKAVDTMGNPLPKENMLVQEPTEAYTVKYIFDKYTIDDKKKAFSSSALCKELINKNMKTFQGDLNWTPSKIIRILDNTKYMGYQLPGKSKVLDTMTKKKVATGVEPIRDVCDEEGNIVTKGNLVKIRCEPIVSEDTWWKAHNRKKGNSSKGSEKITGRHSGLRVSSDAFGRKAFCSCGYCLSLQYTHVAKDNKPAMYRYKCRWQVDHANKYTIDAAIKSNNIICTNNSVSEAKAWLVGKKAFGYVFKNGKQAIIQTLELIEKCKQEEVSSNEISISSLEEELNKLKKRLKRYQEMCADDLITEMEFMEYKKELEQSITSIEEAISENEMDMAVQEKQLFDFEAIKERLDTFIDLKGHKVADEMIDMFVERIIYRGEVDGNEEFLFVINLSGNASDTSSKYRISGYSKEYADSLKDDNNFNIVARMIIPIEECKRYCEEAHRMFKKNNWKPITLKIAIL